jgi:hypothetical protein
MISSFNRRSVSLLQKISIRNMSSEFSQVGVVGLGRHNTTLSYCNLLLPTYIALRSYGSRNSTSLSTSRL